MLQFLLTLADESEHSKIEELYNTYHADMLRYATVKFAQGKCCQYAEDAVQNTFIKIVRHIDKLDFNRTPREIKNYVYSILCNEINSILMSENEVDELDEDEVPDLSQYDPAESLEISEEYEALVKAIENLDEIYSSTMLLAFGEGMRVNEISALMGVSVKTVYTRLERGKKLLKEALRGKGAFEYE